MDDFVAVCRKKGKELPKILYAGRARFGKHPGLLHESENVRGRNVHAVFKRFRVEYDFERHEANPVFWRQFAQIAGTIRGNLNHFTFSFDFTIIFCVFAAPRPVFSQKRRETEFF